MISVIVPVYNVEKYIRKCLDSIVNQTYKDLEIILVDDGSTDDSGLICDEYAARDSRIVVLHQNNKGQSGARNAGIKLSNGEFVCFVDSDDTVDLLYVELLANSISDKDISICGCQIYKYESKLSQVDASSVNYRTLDKDGLWNEVFGNLNNSSCNKLYKKSLLNGLSFLDGMIHGEDLIFNIQYISRCDSGIIMDAQLYHYFSRHGSITKSEFNENKLHEITTKDKALELVSELYPKQILNAQKFCFRARMNVLRGIYKAKVESLYSQIVVECIEYVKMHYSIIKNSIRFKEKIEYILLIYFRVVYIFLTRR